MGSPTAALLANAGYRVLGVDVNPHVLARLGAGEAPPEEPGLRQALQGALASGRLRFALAPQPSDIFLIAVPTPISPDQRADLSCLIEAADAIAAVLKTGDLVVLESTVPPGVTVGLLRERLERSGLRVGVEFSLAHCPERVLPGNLLHELVHNARVVGGFDQPSTERACELYRGWVMGELSATDATTAEMVKLMENSYRDVNIALANEFALIAEHLGVDVWRAIEIANGHPRVQVHRPGPGAGGHCIPVDPWFLAEAAPLSARLLPMARAVNDGMAGYVVENVARRLPDRRQRVVAALGASYKPDVDDIRGSPALRILELLEQHGCQVRLYDPHVLQRPDLGRAVCARALEAVEGADCLLALVAHSAFRDLQPAALGAVMRRRLLVDSCGATDPAAWQEAGFETVRLGYDLGRGLRQ